MSDVRFQVELADLAEHALRELVQLQVRCVTQLLCQLARWAPVRHRLADRGVAVVALDGDLVTPARAAMWVATSERHDAHATRSEKCDAIRAAMAIIRHNVLSVAKHVPHQRRRWLALAPQPVE